MTVKLYITAVDGLSLPDALDAVTAKRREKALKLRSEDDRRRCLGAALLTYRAVNGGVPFDHETGPFGKPYLPGGPCFSISHSGKYAVCAVADAELGVDIEAPRENVARLAARFFTPAEALGIAQSSDPDKLFCEMWVKKESYLKATGTGLMGSLSSFEANDHIGEYAVRYFRHDGYHLAVCVKGEIGELSVYDEKIL